MRDVDLYRQVLGLSEPWSVQRVELNMGEHRVDIHVEHQRGARWRCPHCERELACYDHVAQRSWRHLDTCQFQTHLHARLPRVQCPDHGVVQVTPPWAEPRGRFTALFERWIIDVLKATDTIAGACALLGISWDEAFGVMQRAVERGRQRKREQAQLPGSEPVTHIGVDEKAFRKGHSYMTVVCDLDRGTVEHVAEDRTTASLGEYFQSLSQEQRHGIEAVAMDMWQPYVQATLQHVPLAADKIVFDRFHIMKMMNQAVDAVRKQEHRTLTADGDDRLKGSKYLWLYAAENLPEKHQPTFRTLRNQNLRTSRAWAIKETLRSLWDYRSTAWARKFFNQWFGWARRSKLEPVKKVALTLQRHLDNILTYCRHRVTNGVAEGLNSRIMTLKRKACGYRNKQNFKTVIYFYCGGLRLYPH